MNYDVNAPRPRAVVLVVDRSVEDLEAAREHLGSACIVLTATSGRRALDIAAQEPRPDLVLLGCLAQDQDGPAVLAGLRRDTRTAGVPVIVSGPQAECDGLACLVEGAADFIPKPWTAQVLRARLRNHIELRRMREELNHRNCALHQEFERRLQMESTLHTSTADLDTFGVRLSRELITPVSAVSAFAGSLLAEQAALSVKGRHRLERIVAASRRLSRTMDDALRYSLAGQSEMRIRRVELSAVVADVLAEIGPESSARIAIDPLPPVRADSTMLREVLASLVGNAVKFSGGRADAQVQIRSRTAAGLVEVSVRDNGVGFDMAYRDKLFGLFQRLHAESEFPGTGAGLAIVKRLVLRQGGTVSADSVPGGWTTFRFTIPAAHPDQRSAGADGAAVHRAATGWAARADRRPPDDATAPPRTASEFLAHRSGAAGLHAIQTIMEARRQ